ncbi:MAG: hypothetical protein WBP64_02940 [Nitrososphaeraceae archaeon]
MDNTVGQSRMRGFEQIKLTDSYGFNAIHGTGIPQTSFHLKLQP